MSSRTKKWNGQFAQIVGASFGFLSDEDITRISVKKIDVPRSFDTLLHPVSGGLYDPALGPFDKGVICATCGLGEEDCPGHFGHIELPVPIYNPIVFRNLMQLLKMICFSCHRFRMHQDRVDKYVEMIRLVQCGNVAEAMKAEELEEQIGFKSSVKALHKKDDDDDEASPFTFDDEDVLRTKMTKNSFDYYQYLYKKFLHACPVSKCDNCGAFKISLKNDKGVKVFQQRPSGARLKQVWARGIRYPDVLAKESQEDDDLTNRVTRWLWRLDDQQLSVEEEKKLISAAAKGDDLMEVDDDDGHDSESDEEDDEGNKVHKEKKKAKEESEKKKKTPKKDAKKTGRRKSLKALEKEAEVAEMQAKGAGPDPTTQRYMDPLEVLKHLERLWENNTPIMDLFWGGLYLRNGQKKRQSRPSQFFLRTLPVPPSRFRPAASFDGMLTEHSQSSYLSKIIQFVIDFKKTALEKEKPERTTKSRNVRMNEFWAQIQATANLYMDHETSDRDKNPSGIKQLLEKKQGLFRQNMMGKRVNYCARSVISPDPYLDTNEIGVPLYFAQRLSYPEPVTDYNVAWLRQLVINGTTKHPGAMSVQDQDGKMLRLDNMSYAQRVGIAKTLQKPSFNAIYGENVYGAAKVFRNLVDGDYLIVNRQPTLHKPSMMVHRARVMSHEKTIQMHYANCATYNADFDGDEMNLHLVQNHLARAEAKTIAINDAQYVVPKDGSPIRGLIQDSIVAGVRLTQRDTFLTREQMQHILYIAVNSLDRGRKVEMPLPAILKPKPLWTGKQVMSCIFAHLAAGRPSLYLNSKSQIPEEMWGKGSHEATVIIRDNELLTGILGKKQFGNKAHGVVHAVYELYGHDAAGKLLSAAGRVFIYILQMTGFTCGMDDCILTPSTDKERQRLRAEADASGIVQGGLFTSLVPENSTSVNNEKKEEILDKLSVLLRDPDEAEKWDKHMIGHAGGYTSTTIDACLPQGQLKPFPANNLAMMTISGAKGSRVNQAQMSCLLGQQELEGRRPPVMPNGRPLPMFELYDPSPRAAGFIADRFLTGVKPAEFYYHCMAGREGLIDTAVKTSRSGYLQRCLIKHMESLSVAYDHTVRDSSDGTVVQFRYGEDAIDVMKVGWLTEFDFLADNFHNISANIDPEAIETKLKPVSTKEKKRISKKLAKKEAVDPVLLNYSPGTHLGAVSEDFDAKLEKFISSNPHRFSKDTTGETGQITPAGFKAAMYLKYMSSLAHPGEVVGVVAAQSIGEPSTQMTLNTFHLAGRGDVNVTLGIPRMRELIMTAGNTIKTPTMILTMKPNVTRETAQRVANQFASITVADVLEEIECRESLKDKAGTYCRQYKITLSLKDADEKFELNRNALGNAIEHAFLPHIVNVMGRHLKIKSKRVPLLDLTTTFKFVDDMAASFLPAGGDTGADGEDKAEEAGANAGKRGAADDEEDGASVNKRTKDYDEDEEDDVAQNSDSEDERPQETQTQQQGEDEEEEDTAAKVLSRQKNALMENRLLESSTMDRKKNKLIFVLSANADMPKLPIIEIVDTESKKFKIREIPGIKRATVLKEDKKDPAIKVQTAGINFHHIWRLHSVVDMTQIYTNDVNQMLQFYGIEAARMTLKNEISSVFKAYGISVDPRHLTLVADYMTHEGTVKPLNRNGFSSNTSPFLKMSYETTMKFLTEAALHGEYDRMASPAANISVGNTVRGGTGCFDIRYNLKYN